MRPAEEELAETASEILRANDLGQRTKASANLYPHQWSWDSAFIAIGLAHLDPVRATRELTSLFTSQWSNGMVPHIVFDPDVAAGEYFPDFERWGTAAVSGHSPPAPPHTSGLCQPPVHALAAARIWSLARSRGGEAERDVRAWLDEMYEPLLAWHRYLLGPRDPQGSGLVTIYHPWESGCDNSPRWDFLIGAIGVGDMPPYERHDLQHVADPAQRPSKEEYDCYLWLVEELKAADYDDAVICRKHPFLVKDVLFSAILVAANLALADIAATVDASSSDRRTLAGWIQRGREGIESRWDPELKLALDHDLRNDMPIRTRTVAGLAPLVAGAGDPSRLAEFVRTLQSPELAGDPRLRWPLPPSTSPTDIGFEQRSYWRGPTWPVINWLLWWALQEAGFDEAAAHLRRAALQQLLEGGLAEYFEPFTGEPLGAGAQSWTAAVALDWLAAG